MKWAAVLAVMLSATSGPESLAGQPYRAVTFDPHERRQFLIPGMERVTGASGGCIEESLDPGEMQTLTIEATCAGLRTAMAWTGDSVRVHLMVCAEDIDRPAALVKTRKALQKDLAGLKLKTVTACVRNGQVQLWGWVMNAADKKRVAALEAKYGTVASNHVELIEGDPE